MQNMVFVCVCFFSLKSKQNQTIFVGACVYIMVWLGFSLSYYIVYFLRFKNLTFISILCTSSLASPNIVISSPPFRMRELCDQCQKQSPESVTCFMPIIKCSYFIYIHIRGKFSWVSKNVKRIHEHSTCFHLFPCQSRWFYLCMCLCTTQIIIST